MLKKLSNGCVALVQCFLPDPFICLFLVGIVVCGGFIVVGLIGI